MLPYIRFSALCKSKTQKDATPTYKINKTVKSFLYYTNIRQNSYTFINNYSYRVFSLSQNRWILTTTRCVKQLKREIKFCFVAGLLRYGRPWKIIKYSGRKVLPNRLSRREKLAARSISAGFRDDLVTMAILPML